MIRREFLKSIPKLGVAAGLAVAAPQVVAASEEPQPNPASYQDELMEAIMDGGLYGLFKSGHLPLNPHFFRAMREDGIRKRILNEWADDATSQYSNLELNAPTSLYLRATPIRDLSGTTPHQIDNHTRILAISSSMFHDNDLEHFAQSAEKLASAPLNIETSVMADMVDSHGYLNDRLFTSENNNILKGNPSIDAGAVDRAKRQLQHNTGNDDLQLKDCVLVYDNLHVPRMSMALGVGLGYLPTLPRWVHHPGLGDMWFLTTQHQTGHVLGQYQYRLGQGTPRFNFKVYLDAENPSDAGDSFQHYILATANHNFGLLIQNPHFMVGSDGTQS